MDWIQRLSYLANGHTRLFVLVVATYSVTICRVQAQDDFGSRQIAQICDDRPEMKPVLEENPKMIEFLREGFNKGDEGRCVYWLEKIDNLEHPNAICHLQSYRGYPALVHVPADQAKSPVDECAGLVFEFFNLQNRDGFTTLTAKALNREMSPEKYADEMLRLEYQALQQTKRFFEENPIQKFNPEKDVWYSQTMTMDYSDFDKHLEVLNSSKVKGDFRYTYADYIRSMLQPGSVSVPSVLPENAGSELQLEYLK